MLNTFVVIVHLFVCLVLMFVVLLQQGKGGGMGSAFGGASAQVFGGSGAGNILTRATAICAVVFMLTSVTLAHFSSARDSGLRARQAEEEARLKDRGQKRAKTDAVVPPSSAAPGTAPNAPSAAPGTTSTPESTEPKAPTP